MNQKCKWDLTEIFKTEDDFNKSKEFIKINLKNIESFKGKLEESAENIAKCYNIYEKVLENFEKIYAYCMLSFHQNMADTSRIQMYKEAESLGAEISTKLSFIEPELSNIDENKLKKYIIENNELKRYERLLNEIIDNKKHVLSKELESLLASLGEVFNASENAYDIFTNTEFKFPEISDENGEKVAITHANYSKYIASNNRKVRKNAFDAMYSLYEKHINTITELYISRVKEVTIKSKVRNFETSLHAAVHHDDATIDVYNSLIEVVNENLELNHRYMELKKKLLNDGEFHIYDVYVNKLNDKRKEVSYDVAKKIVLEALTPLGEEYQEMLKKAFDERWIDVYEEENKRSGAYSMGVYGVHPYVLTNFTNQEEDVSTIAHELGHAMHSYYSNTNQNVIDANYTIMVSEVASTVNEIILGKYLIENEKDKVKKAALINSELDRIRATLIRQAMFAEFEKNVHEKIENHESLTSDILCDIYLDLNKKYFGESVIIDETIRYEWARIPQFYSCFYVYKYATGISAAISIASKILNKEIGAVENYKEMLKMGCTKKSVDLLKMVGVDLESKKPYEEAFKFFKENLDKLEELL